jgi:hypothetical protein
MRIAEVPARVSCYATQAENRLTKLLIKPFSSRNFRLFAILAITFSGTKLLLAQQATALMTGSVKDASGAVVVGAKVTLKNASTNVARTQITGSRASTNTFGGALR